MAIGLIRFGQHRAGVSRVASSLAAAAWLCCATAVNAANIYRWTDASGVVHYSQTPPPQTPSTVVHPGSPSSMEVPPAQPAPTETPAPAATADAAPKASPEQLQAACNSARERLAFLESRPPRRISITDADGTVHRMDEARWQQERDEVMANIGKYCR